LARSALVLSSFGGHERIKRLGGLQIGGGITDKNALSWIECGASKVSHIMSNLRAKQRSSVKVIVTSYLFPEQKFSLQRLQTISALVGKEHLVIDIRCVC
jgi:phosphoribosylformimino-5-aminoimidazole carboxamide ribotide isomerase